MKKLLNTLFVTSEDAYLSLDGENIVVSRDRHEIGRFPLTRSPGSSASAMPEPPRRSWAGAQSAASG